MDPRNDMFSSFPMSGDALSPDTSAAAARTGAVPDPLADASATAVRDPRDTLFDAQKPLSASAAPTNVELSHDAPRSFKDDPALASSTHAAWESVAGTAEKLAGTVTGNDKWKQEGQARVTTARFERDAAAGKPISRN
ncbi:hypothetical protein AMAG_16667 [Allomyces macrogynus ATCC 38327]|uniref:Uncharacterized protein n=1 Tax=Allomyces macrogynus (strain ATCC 38327) TaxID=578462 RepID=A0A0L0TBV5_ALLM3|nr:hypothetical protein AMAG_16667 [Allomyces macrogynus ATCC 38327]|eukprot:KNE72180.1 hypothetical protein AMAG_16667 [Allomyces macrogynus ATCC 38327]